jgi:hypothetical protein
MLKDGEFSWSVLLMAGSVPAFQRSRIAWTSMSCLPIPFRRRPFRADADTLGFAISFVISAIVSLSDCVLVFFFMVDDVTRTNL